MKRGGYLEALPYNLSTGVIGPGELNSAYHCIVYGDNTPNNIQAGYDRARFTSQHNPKTWIIMRPFPDNDIWRTTDPVAWMDKQYAQWLSQGSPDRVVFATQNEPHLEFDKGERWAQVAAWEAACIRRATELKRPVSAGNFSMGTPGYPDDDFRAYLEFEPMFRALAEAEAAGIPSLWTPNAYFGEDFMYEHQMMRSQRYGYRTLHHFGIDWPLWKRFVFRETGIWDGWKVKNADGTRKYNLDEGQYVNQIVANTSARDDFEEMFPDLVKIGVTPDMMTMPFLVFAATTADDHKDFNVGGNGLFRHWFVGAAHSGKLDRPKVEWERPMENVIFVALDQDSANIRNGPSVRSGVVGTVRRGGLFTLWLDTEQTGNDGNYLWAQMQHGEVTGWIATAGITNNYRLAFSHVETQPEPEPEPHPAPVPPVSNPALHENILRGLKHIEVGASLVRRSYEQAWGQETPDIGVDNES